MSQLRRAISEAKPVEVILAAEKELEKSRPGWRRQEAVARGAPVFPYKIGEVVAGKGVFAGPWLPKLSLAEKNSKSYLLFAAPTNLTDQKFGNARLWKFYEAAREVGKIKNWHGHHGCDYVSAIQLYEALKNGSYDGGWFVPPLELLTGRNAVDRRKIHRYPLWQYKNKPGFGFDFRDESVVYWSSTECELDKGWAVNLLVKGKRAEAKNTHLACRPMRAEEAGLS